MAFKTSKFTIGTYSGEGSTTAKEYATLLLTKVKDAFIEAGDGSWSQVGDIDQVVDGYTGDQGMVTVQLRSSVTLKNLRIWSFNGNVSWTASDTPTENTNATLKIYTGNLLKRNYSSSSGYYAFGDNSGIYFAVSDSDIDPDFAKDLGLSMPMFGINNEPTNGAWLCYDYSNKFSYYGATVTVITDGSMFGLITYSSSYAPAVFYAPDMFVTANAGDNETEGVISMNSNSNVNFYFGDNTNNGNTTCALFNDANGNWDFDGMVQGCDTGKPQLLTSQDSSKMLTGPVCYWMYPYTFEGSTEDGVVDGIGLKGWVNTNYLRSANNTVLASGQKGTKFASGTWFCLNAGTLIRWDGSDNSPFEAEIVE